MIQNENDYDAINSYLHAHGFVCETEGNLNVYRYGEIEIRDVRQFFIVIFVDPWGTWQCVEPFEHGGHGVFDLSRKIDLMLRYENYFRALRLSASTYKHYGKAGRPFRGWLEYMNYLRSYGFVPAKFKQRVTNHPHKGTNDTRTEN